MKNLRLTALALGAGLALTGAAWGQDITVGIAGPMTGGEATFGRQNQNRELGNRPNQLPHLVRSMSRWTFIDSLVVLFARLILIPNG